MKNFLIATIKLVLIALCLVGLAPAIMAFGVISPIVGTLMIIFIPIILIGVIIGLRSK